MKVKYTIPEFFKAFPELTQRGVAQEANVSYQLMRQYACGAKIATPKRTKEIEKAIRRIGRNLMKKATLLLP